MCLLPETWLPALVGLGNTRLPAHIPDCLRASLSSQPVDQADAHQPINQGGWALETCGSWGSWQLCIEGGLQAVPVGRSQLATSPMPLGLESFARLSSPAPSRPMYLTRRPMAFLLLLFLPYSVFKRYKCVYLFRDYNKILKADKITNCTKS